MEMFIYRVLNEETKLYDLGVIIAEDKEKAKEIVKSEFDLEKYSCAVLSKENICDLFASSVLNSKCININELCFQYGYKTENEMKLQKKLNAIQPLINTLVLYKTE